MLGGDWEGYRFELERLVDAGDSIVGIGTYRGTYRATGTPMQARVAHVWQLQGGQVVAFEQFTARCWCTGPWRRREPRRRAAYGGKIQWM